MLIRIVKMTLEKQHVAEFRRIFEKHRIDILNFEGLSFLELYEEKGGSHIFITISHWKNEAALENYRSSEYFRTLWSKAKSLFADTPQAWSLEKS